MTVTCLVQEGLTPPAVRAEIAKRIVGIYGDLFGDAPPENQIKWIEVAAGCGFTAGKPSTSSLAMAVVPDGTTREQRTAFLAALCKAWTEVTGCSVNEIVASAVDAGGTPQTS